MSFDLVNSNKHAKHVSTIIFNGTLGDFIQMSNGTHGTNDQPSTPPRRISLNRSTPRSHKFVKIQKSYTQHIVGKRCAILTPQAKQYTVIIRTADGKDKTLHCSRTELINLKATISAYNSKHP